MTYLHHQIQAWQAWQTKTLDPVQRLFADNQIALLYRKIETKNLKTPKICTQK